MKRKIIALLLTVSTAISLAGCGGTTNNSQSAGNNNTSQQEDSQKDEGESNKDSDSRTDEESSGDTRADGGVEKTSPLGYKYISYEDLPFDRGIALTGHCYDYPNWWYDSVVGADFYSRNVNDFYIIVAYNDENPYTGELDGILEQTYPEFIDAVYEEEMVTKEVDLSSLTTEKVTLPNGIEAIKFEGVQPASYEDRETGFPVWGYSFMYEGISMTFGYCLNKDTPELRAEYEEEAQDVVTRMTSTLRKDYEF